MFSRGFRINLVFTVGLTNFYLHKACIKNKNSPNSSLKPVGWTDFGILEQIEVHNAARLLTWQKMERDWNTIMGRTSDLWLKTHRHNKRVVPPIRGEEALQKKLSLIQMNVTLSSNLDSKRSKESKSCKWKFEKTRTLRECMREFQ